MAKQGPALIAVFAYLDDLLAALEALRKEGRRFTVLTPIPAREVQEAMNEKAGPVRLFTLFGGILGAASGIGLAVYTVLQWKLIMSGKPIIPWVPFVIVAFEFTILFGVGLTFVGMLLMTRLPRFRIPAYYDPRFSEDRFGLLVPYAGGTERDEITRLLQETGAEEIHETEA
ncbi:MAG: DUF3341 domain-containing protein [bacterium]